MEIGKMASTCPLVWAPAEVQTLVHACCLIDVNDRCQRLIGPGWLVAAGE